MDEIDSESTEHMADSPVDNTMEDEVAAEHESSLEFLPEEPPIHGEADNHDQQDEDDDFGSFDEASFEELQEPEPKENLNKEQLNTALRPLDFHHPEQFLSKVDELLDTIFPVFPDTRSTPTTLLKAEASEKLDTLSRTPRLNPPNWIRLKIRHNLLIKLGVPINLDELESANSVAMAYASISHNRRKSIDENDIQWEGFTIPEVETFNLTAEQKQELLGKTGDTLSRIEEDNLNNTSQLFLESSLESALNSKLAQMKANYDQLIKLSAVWQDQMKELRNSQEIYESVVQNMVGYSQKLQRNEIIEHLQRTKGKKGKRTF